MKYIIYLFYRYYDKGTTKQIAFIKSLLCFMFVIFINIISLMLFIVPTFLQSFHFASKGQSYLFFIGLFGIGYFILNKFVLEEEIKSILPNKNVSSHGWMLFFYILSSIIFMTLALISLRHQ
jgi:hypothetical protein